MIRKNLYITERQEEQLNRIAKVKDIKFSELVRRIFDEYIDDYIKKEHRILIPRERQQPND